MLQLARELNKRMKKQPASRRSSQNSQSSDTTAAAASGRVTKPRGGRAARNRRQPTFGQRKRKTGRGGRAKASAAAMSTLDFFHQQTLNATSKEGQ